MEKNILVKIIKSFPRCNTSEYKYIWRDRNTSFSKTRGRYDRARCSDNFNRKKVIIHEFSQLTSYQFVVVIKPCYVFILFILWTCTLKIMRRFLQENFDKFRRKIPMIFLWKVDYVLQKNFTIFAEKFNDFWKKFNAFCEKTWRFL